MKSCKRLFSFDPDLIRHPQPAYEELHANPSLYRDEVTGSFVVSRYDEVVQVLQDSDTFSSRQALSPQLGEFINSLSAELPPERLDSLLLLQQILLCKDGADHRRLRKLINRAFTPSVVNHLKPRISENCDTLINEISDGETLNFTDRFAKPFTIGVIAGILGVPLKDYSKFREWTTAIITLVNGDPISENVLTAYMDSAAEFMEYFSVRSRELLAEPDSSLLSEITRIHHNDKNSLVTDIVGSCISLLVAGHETTVHLLCGSVLELARNPKIVRRIEEDMESLVPKFLNEILRLQSPVQGLFRTATRNAVIGGELIPKGSSVLVLYGAANRDPDKFPNADEISLHRDSRPGNLAFGFGRHVCLGSALALAEGQIAVSAWIGRFPRSVLAEPADRISYYRHLLLRGPRSLAITAHA
ncbi:cytochrome P450 [Streptomyces sp. 3211]|uniref:cytochrome P450 n=1 Tax=Streptomyces sp. 3211 TaxID=1964449 RepID=UPI0009A4AFED|nr:cytochrome P450 [Streptomyces sp. 3211]